MVADGSNSGRAYQNNTSISLAESLSGFGFLRSNAKFPSWDGEILDSIAFEAEKVDLFGLDLEHLRWSIGIDKSGLGQGKALALGLGLLD